MTASVRVEIADSPLTVSHRLTAARVYARRSQGERRAWLRVLRLFLAHADGL